MPGKQGAIADPILRLAELADQIVPFTIQAVCALRVADHLGDGPLTVEALSRSTGAHAASLARALRVLADVGLFVETAPGLFDLTPASDLLRSDHPLSLRDAFLPQPANVRMFEGIEHTLRTGESAFEHAHGRDLWDHLARNPADRARFSGQMRSLSRLESQAIVRLHDWSRYRTVVDVGGGDGTFLTGLLQRHEDMRGVLFDLPGTVQGAPAVLSAAGVAGRCEIVPGSFLADAIPRGADAYVLKRIVYGWPDREVRTLLRSLQAALRPASRVIVIETVSDDGKVSDLAARMDLLMLIQHGPGSRVRSIDELERLFAAAGMRLTGMAFDPSFAVIEFQPER